MRLYEKRVKSTHVNVDRDNGMIRNVKLLGRKSRNRREYSSDALRSAIGLYEGAKVFVNHTKDHSLDRDWEDWAGRVENVKLRSDGIYGDIKLRRQGSRFEEIIEAAEEFPNDFGMSHVAEGESRTIGGREIVETIHEVFSVDIVLVPATTAGLFESEGSSPLLQAVEMARQAIEIAQAGLASSDPDVLDRCISQLDALNDRMQKLVPDETLVEDSDDDIEEWGESFKPSWLL